MRGKKLLAALVALAVPAFAGVADAAIANPPGFGKTFDELEKLAVKEGRVRMVSNLFSEEVPQVLKAFYGKYPTIKVEFTRGSESGYSERILSERWRALVEYDLIDIANEFYSKYLKAQVLAGPFEWRKLFPGITEVQVSSDRPLHWHRVQLARHCLQSDAGCG
jgi:hypothetical protein